MFVEIGVDCYNFLFHLGNLVSWQIFQELSYLVLWESQGRVLHLEKDSQSIPDSFSHSDIHVKWYLVHSIQSILLEKPKQSPPLPLGPLLDQHWQRAYNAINNISEYDGSTIYIQIL